MNMAGALSSKLHFPAQLPEPDNALNHLMNWVAAAQLNGKILMEISRIVNLHINTNIIISEASFSLNCNHG
jgi:hypothetical protein